MDKDLIIRLIDFTESKEFLVKSYIQDYLKKINEEYGFKQIADVNVRDDNYNIVIDETILMSIPKKELFVDIIEYFEQNKEELKNKYKLHLDFIKSNYKIKDDALLKINNLIMQEPFIRESLNLSVKDTKYDYIYLINCKYCYDVNLTGTLNLSCDLNDDYITSVANIIIEDLKLSIYNYVRKLSYDNITTNLFYDEQKIVIDHIIERGNKNMALKLYKSWYGMPKDLYDKLDAFLLSEKLMGR